MTRRTRTAVYQKEFSFSVRPWRTPFGTVGRPEVPLWFLYLTNRQSYRFTGLFPPCPDEWFAAAQQTFTTGYTQLWLLEKRVAVHPAKGTKSSARNRSRLIAPPRPHYPTEDEMERNSWPGNLFVVLREPYPTGDSRDVVGAWTTEQEALVRAERYSRQHNRRSVVGLLLADCSWH